MEHEQNLTPDMLISMLDIKLSSQATKQELKEILRSGKRIVFILQNTLEVIFGKDLHTELIKETGIDANVDLHIPGTVQEVNGLIRINCDDYVVAAEMYNTTQIQASEYLDIIKEQIRKFLYE